MSKKKKIVIVIGISVIILALIFFAIVRAVSSPVSGTIENEAMEVLVQKVKKEKLKESILVTGKIVPEEEQKIFKDVENGEISQFMVEENEKVKKGDPLFVYDGTSIEREFNAAVNARNRSKQNVTMIENQINELTKQIDEVKKIESAINAVDQDEITNISQSDVRQLEMEKSQLALELESAKLEVEIAQAEVNDLDKMKKELTVTSNIDGIVVKINQHENRDDSGLSEPVIHIVSDAPFKVIGTMSEYDSVKIKQDQPVIIRPKVFKEREWNGKVDFVSQYPSDDSNSELDMYGGGDTNVTMYPFKVTIEDDTADLRQGYHVSLEVDVSGSEETIAVPHMAIMDELMLGIDEENNGFIDDFIGINGELDDHDMQFVYVLIDGILERRDVETGKMSDKFVEIISGVELDELVVVNPTPEMHDGMEVANYDQVD